MKVYSVLSLNWRGEFISGAGSIKACLSLEQVKEIVKKEVDLRRHYMLCFKFSEDGTGAKASLRNYKGEQEEIRTFVSDIDVAPERLRHLEFYINNIIVYKIVCGEASRIINYAIEANKVRVSLPGTKFEHTKQDISDDELKELWKFYEKVQYTNPPKIEYTDLLEIQYIDPPDEQNIDPLEKTSFF